MSLSDFYANFKKHILIAFDFDILVPQHEKPRMFNHELHVFCISVLVFFKNVITSRVQT